MKGSSFLKLYFLVSMLFLLNGCMSMRSAKGLNPGQLMVSYNAPLAGDIRLGMTKNLEARFSIMGESYESDLFFHFHNNISDIGIALGYQWLGHDEKNHNYTGNMIISKELNKRFNPYVGYNFHIDSDRKNEKFFYSIIFHYFTIGCEIFIFDSEKFPVNLILTPEIGYSPQRIAPDFYNSYYLGYLGLGISFDFCKMIKK